MITPEELRDVWRKTLDEDNLHRNAAPPEPWQEIEYLGWMMGASNIPVIDINPDTTWIWSDLHLSDRATMEAWRRPFRDTRHMDREILRAWRRAIRPSDTIICLGDVAGPDLWQDAGTVADLRACPGHRILILGNHDVQWRDQLRSAGFKDQNWAAILPTSPMLALSHLPVRFRPIPARNVHGHIHGGDPPSPKHMNVSVERTGYRPVRLADLLERIR